MDGFTWAAFVCYLIAALGGVLIGLTYLLRSKFMPYHEEALGQNWDQLDRRLQTLLIAFIRGGGGIGVGASISVLIMLFIPFRGGELWTHYAIPAVLLITFLSVLYGVLLVRTRTQAQPPIAPVAAGVVLTVIGFILSFF
jgi:hypothetical protein